MTEYPLDQAGHHKFTRAIWEVADINEAFIAALDREIEYHYALKAMTAERDMLLQRVECLRPKHPACQCKGHEHG